MALLIFVSIFRYNNKPEIKGPMDLCPEYSYH